MKKIFELNKDLWASGISFQPSSQKGGLFRQASNFDPFEVLDQFRPGYVATNYNSVAITKDIKYFVNYTDGTTPYTYGFAGTGTTSLYSINATSGVITDESAKITTTASARGAISWYDNVSSVRGFVYATNSTIRANSIPVALANDLEILTGLETSEHKFEPGADGNLYFTNGNKVGKITSTTGTAGNIGNAFTFPTGYTIRDIANDGEYLVIIADNQPSGATDNVGNYNCIIGYWNYASEQLTKRYNIQLNLVTAVQIMNGNAYVFSSQGIYVCNVSSYPQIAFPFNGTSSLVNSHPRNASQVTKRGNDVILWGDGGSNKVYGYGSLGFGDNKIVFHQTSVAQGSVTAIGVQGASTTRTSLLVATGSNSALYIQGNPTVSTRDTSSVITSYVTLAQPHRYGYARIVAQSKLASGETMTFNMFSQFANITAANTFDYATDGAKQSKIFLSRSASAQSFNEFAISFTSNFAIQSIEIWAEPVEGPNQAI